ncbi:fungal-specific transcription factor domain protein [Penicillium nucicola]|uniref:fungal-specific transcription factor domain protein n=1 Tax=Penicillium nucicola TaxID=1850975 RepID=UPI002545A1C6|nr:fungal-specific transcription factor domain protein [Penicillium nucicola]KAJ5746930.1 fungal-specific transcription factor domain protein [Penicillium nucicola]
MDDSMDMVAATRACASCKKNKRRCDKSLPSCNLCLRSNRICDYSDNTQSSHRDEIADLRSRLQRLEQLIASSPNPPPYPASDGEACNTDDQHPYIENLSVLASYLDSEVWSSCNIPNHSNPVYAPPEILSLVGGFIEIENLKLRYFSSIHTWMPIVSKLRLNRLTQNTTGPLKADTALLLLCLRLSFSYGKSASTSKFYHTIKEFSNELELKGIISLRTVQAGLLLCVYEIGHGIFPAAFLNISCCARQGIVLGLHHKSAPQSMGPPRSWVDWEERQRVWWLIIILDRYIAIGVDHRPLCTEDPTKDTLLPASDSAWDSGEMMSPERVLLSSGSTNTVSSFARMAQASNLLGLVIRHCNDTSMDLEYVLNNFELLSRSLKSLLEMTGNDKDAMSSEMSTATALCFR